MKRSDYVQVFHVKHVLDLWLVLHFDAHKLFFLKILLNIPATLLRLPTKLHKSHHRKELNKMKTEDLGSFRIHTANATSIQFFMERQGEAAESVLLSCSHCLELKGLVLKIPSAGLVLDDCNSWELCRYLEHCMTMLFRHWFQFTEEAFMLKKCPNSSDQ